MTGPPQSRRHSFTRESGSFLDELDFGPFDGPISGRKREPIAAQPHPKQRQ
jgi:hypothetical protein